MPVVVTVGAHVSARGVAVGPLSCADRSRRRCADNKGKQRLGFNEAAVRQPKPFGAEGRGVEVRPPVSFVLSCRLRNWLLQVKEADDYLDDVEAKLAKMYNRNKHAEVT